VAARGGLRTLPLNRVPRAAALVLRAGQGRRRRLKLRIWFPGGV